MPPMVQVDIHGTGMTLSNLDKVLYPAAGFTKGQVIDYYERISAHLLPHLAGRPLSLVRCPDGVAGERFFQKRCPAGKPPFVKTAEVTSKRFGTIAFCLAENVQTLVWLGNYAALEIHPYLFRAHAEERPTMLVFDLDPGPPAALHDCLEVGCELRDRLGSLGLKCFPKTSGGKGLHLAVPLNRAATFAETKALALALARSLEADWPTRVTSVMAKAARPGKVFIDWSQNDHGKTTVAVYSLRARERPTVSTPLTWDEVERARRRRHHADRLVFEAPALLARVEEVGDLFAPVLTLKQTLPRAAVSR